MNEEHEIQSDSIAWYKSNFPSGIVFAVPNAGKRTMATMNYLVREGLLPGAPDVVVMRRDGKIVFCEFKTKTGRLSVAQKALKEKCDKIDDELYFVCRSVEDFKNAVTNI